MRTLPPITVLVCALFLALATSQGSFAGAKAKPDVKIPEVEFRGGIYYLVLDAKTPYGRGYQHGAALKFPIAMAVRNFKEWLRAHANIKDPTRMIKEYAANTQYIETVKKEVPDLFEEMRGIADGSGADFNELFVYQSFDELFLFLQKSGSLDNAVGHCTTTGVYGRSGKPNFVTHNNDIPVYHEAVGTVLHIKYPGSDLEILQATFAGQIGQNGVNNRGVAVGINTIADLPTSNAGIPVSFNVRKILECKDRHEAVRYLKSKSFGTAMNYTIGDREKVISVETWESNVVVLDQFPDKVVAHTNHSLQKNAPVTFKMDPSSGGGSYGFTQQRLELAIKTLSANPNSLKFGDIKRLMRTRPILVNPGKPSGRTLMSMIAVIPAKGSPVLYNTPDSPNWFEHVKFEF
jgi:isopenicillin-N N-acyltransferase-like protein